MKRAGFTMIELIFVIVILGILAAVAIPKLSATQKSAKAQVIESFVGTMNRTVLPSIYVSAQRSGGSIASGYSLADYTDIPNEVGTVDLSKCANPVTATSVVATAANGAKIYCRDGNSTNPPVFAFTTDLNTTMPTSYFEQ